MTSDLSQEQKTGWGAPDAGRYFRYMAEFVGFTQADAAAIRESRFIIEKHLPRIVAHFYDHLLRYPPTREHFLKSDGTVDREYLQLRMQHLTNFWRRTADGEYDDEYARYVDYVGRAHTSTGADPGIYVAERYVIGQVGFMQHAITSALSEELHEIDPEWEIRAVKAWNLLMMVILEMLSRAYSPERELETFTSQQVVDHAAVFELAVDTYERGLGIGRTLEVEEIVVGRASEIPEGERKIIHHGDLSIGVFHHQGRWYALRNYCLHRGGPIATGTLEGDVLTCPWHGYRYDLTNGQLQRDSSAVLEMYPVEVRDGMVHIQVPATNGKLVKTSPGAVRTPDEAGAGLAGNEFPVDELRPGRMRLVTVEGQPVVIFNVDGQFFATQNACTHEGGPLNEGHLRGSQVTCPWHGSGFDVTSGQVQRGPADRPLRRYRVVVNGSLGRVESLLE